MNWMAEFIVTRSRLAWAVALCLVLAVGLAASEIDRLSRESARASALQTDAPRRSVELMAQTLNGNVMGAISVLGVTDEDVKQETRNQSTPNGPRLLALLQSVGFAYDAEGTFVVGEDGLVKSSWDISGKSSTGVNVKFRPYFQMAMQGLNNVYAAVSLATGQRALYFSAPVYTEKSRASAANGAVVVRSGLAKVDTLLMGDAEIALLISPQGVVFASTRPEWIGHLAGVPTPERIKAIRDLKQFGSLFENKAPVVLPLAMAAGVQMFEGRRYLAANSRVDWNDPYGDWKLVLLEDLSRTVPGGERLAVAGGASAVTLLLVFLLRFVLRGHHAQRVAARQLQSFAQAQENSAEHKSQLAQASLSLQQAKSVHELGQVFLLQAHQMLGALQGVIYAFERDDAAEMSLLASYACGDKLPLDLAVGEGWLGQCAVERRTLSLQAPDEGFWAIRSGLGEARPGTVAMTPVILNDVLLGVVEIALPGTMDAAQQERYEELVPVLAMNLEILRRNQVVQEKLSLTAEAEQVKAAQLEFQQVLVDTIPYPVFYKGPDTRFMGFNKAYGQAFGVGTGDLVGKRVLDLDYLPEADRLAYQAEDEATIANASTAQREMKIPFADGKLHDTLYFVSGFRHADGSAGGLVGTFIDIGALKNAERELARLSDIERFNRLARGREARILELKKEVNELLLAAGESPRYATALTETTGDRLDEPHPDCRSTPENTQELTLGELVDLDELQKLFSSFCESIGIAAAIIDLKGVVLASSRWQRACTDFHRVNADSCARCIESDTELALKLQDGAEYTLYQCKNGMTDCASPIIVEGRHLANVFIGQFHVGSPDITFFTRQAKQFGYAEADYLQAIGEAPVMDERRLPVILSFLTGFARMVTTMSLARHRADEAKRAQQAQAQMLQRERMAAMSLAEDAEQARKALEERGVELKS